MAWFKIDDGFHNHPKILEAGNASAGLWVRLGSYAGQQLTDGFIPAAIAKMYGTKAEISRLLAVGMLAEVDGGYRIPDFLDFNPSADTIREKRAETAKRVAEWRAKKAAEEAASNSVGNSVTDGDVTALVTRPVTLLPTRPDPTPLNTSPPTDDFKGEPVDISAWANRRRLQA